MEILPLKFTLINFSHELYLYIFYFSSIRGCYLWALMTNTRTWSLLLHYMHLVCIKTVHLVLETQISIWSGPQKYRHKNSALWFVLETLKSTVRIICYWNVEPVTCVFVKFIAFHFKWLNSLPGTLKLPHAKLTISLRRELFHGSKHTYMQLSLRHKKVAVGVWNM